MTVLRTLLLAVLLSMAVAMATATEDTTAVATLDSAEADTDFDMDLIDEVEEEEEQDEDEEEQDVEDEQDEDEQDEDIDEGEALVSTSENVRGCVGTYNAAAMVKAATAYQIAYAKNKTKYSQPKRQFGPKVAFSDCSSFTWSVLSSIKLGCLIKNTDCTTANLQKLIKTRGGFKKTAVPGDLIMFEDHVGIVTNTNGNKVNMVAMGLSGCKSTGLKTVAQLLAGRWATKPFVGYWTPRD